jgi:hypothetical protein
MNKCCEKCVWYTGISTAIGRCSWSAQQSPFWYMTGLPAKVEADEGADCLAFVPVKGESCKKKPV